MFYNLVKIYQLYVDKSYQLNVDYSKVGYSITLNNVLMLTFQWPLTL